jgi:peptidoglycan/xylan/chitin deacetylase (PgdA/CDA1 family)
MVARWAAPVVRPWASGVGAILMLHRIADPPAWPRTGWPRGIETPPDLLDQFIALARRRGYSFVSLDALHDRLRSGTAVRRCLAVTFDDGYADVYTRAYPVLKQQGIPFTVFLTTGFLDRSYVPWWYLAERALAQGDAIPIEGLGATPAGTASTQADREWAFARVAEEFDEAAPDAVRPLAIRLFGASAVDGACAEYAITWQQAEALASDPLVTIGAHTVSHRNLKRLPAGEAEFEIRESARVLQARLGRCIEHFAYPFGSPPHAGPREFEMVEALGFKTAVTTRVAPLQGRHAAHLAALPRVYADSAQELDHQLSGAVSLLRYRKRVVTDR